jgi:hypothetical protein
MDMFEQIEWAQVGAAIFGIILLIDATFKMVSLRYYCFLYEKPFLRKKTEGHMRQLRIERDAQRYAVTIREMGIGAILIAWGFGLHETTGGWNAIIWGTLTLYAAVMLFIWWRKKRDK